MKKVIALLCILSTGFTTMLSGASDTFMDYQNYNHGYCPDCNYYPCRCDTGYCPDANPCPTCPHAEGEYQPPYPQQPDACPATCNTCDDVCDPCAPVCRNSCGISICAIAIAIAAVAAAAAIIVGSSNGSSN